MALPSSAAQSVGAARGACAWPWKAARPEAAWLMAASRA